MRLQQFLGHWLTGFLGGWTSLQSKISTNNKSLVFTAEHSVQTGLFTRVRTFTENKESLWPPANLMTVAAQNVRSGHVKIKTRCGWIEEICWAQIRLVGCIWSDCLFHSHWLTGCLMLVSNWLTISSCWWQLKGSGREWVGKKFGKYRVVFGLYILNLMSLKKIGPLILPE